MKTFKLYWWLYGGRRALLTSVYLYVALGVTALLWPLWGAEAAKVAGWTRIAIIVLPSLLGFSMGGMAIMLAFSNATIFRAVTQKGKEPSFFLKVVANFFHFILVQTAALILVLTALAYDQVWISGPAFFAFAYALLVALATAGQLLWTARIFNRTGAQMGETGADNDEK